MKYLIGLLTLFASPLSAETGNASYYGNEFNGRRTASGQTYRPERLTAAHRTLPFDTMVEVTNGNKSVIVRITDRGPFIKGRIIDLSRAAAKKIDLFARGVGRVSLRILEKNP